MIAVIRYNTVQDNVQKGRLLSFSGLVKGHRELFERKSQETETSPMTKLGEKSAKTKEKPVKSDYQSAEIPGKSEDLTPKEILVESEQNIADKSVETEDNSSLPEYKTTSVDKLKDIFGGGDITKTIVRY